MTEQENPATEAQKEPKKPRAKKQILPPKEPQQQADEAAATEEVADTQETFPDAETVAGDAPESVVSDEALEAHRLRQFEEDCADDKELMLQFAENCGKAHADLALKNGHRNIAHHLTTLCAAARHARKAIGATKYWQKAGS